MKVKLAGFNIDIENIQEIKKILGKYPDIQKENIDDLLKTNWTPETLCASYARISRDERPINELREESRTQVDKARRSNKAIIFDMGHSSIAEHGVFNIDIVDISRLAAERLERSRLVSFTEKSQRYIKIGSDILYPEEFNEDKDFIKKYKSLVNDLFDTYNTLHDKILPGFLDKNPGVDPKSREYRDIINLAKEDARYILPLATLTQVGMTINARNLERVIKKLSADNLAESSELGKELFKVVDGYAPSLVKYTEPTDYEIRTYPLIKESIGDPELQKEQEEVQLIDIDKDLEDKVLAALVVKSSSMDFNSSKKLVSDWDKTKKEDVFMRTTKHLDSFDPILREFEMSNVEFNIVMSATAFAQFKRHRMATIIDGEYSPALGVKIPDSIIEAGLTDLFLEKTALIEELYSEAKEKWGPSSDYILSNAHRKNVILKCNFRELVHITRLRSDKHAQWDIHNLSDKMIDLVKDHLPLFGSLLCGKDDFNKKN